MKNRKLGDQTMVHPIGLGCMGLSEFYGAPTDQVEAISLLHRAIDLGTSHFDTAELYGMGANETLLGQAFADRRDKVFLATKFGINRDKETGAVTGLDGSGPAIRAACDGSLSRLKTDYIDLYYQHRMDTSVPIAETIGTLAELVAEGKIRNIGLSECSAETLRKASAIHKIAAVQSEYSIFSRDIEQDILPACKQLGTALVAYSPLGRGMLGGKFTKENAPDAADYRSYSPRFAEQNYATNLALVEQVKSIAEQYDAHPAQIALAWVLGQGDFVHVIPGTTKEKNLIGNLAAGALKLDAAAMNCLDELSSQVSGDRYADMRSVNN